MNNKQYNKWVIEITNQEYNGNIREAITAIKTKDVFGIQLY